MLCTSVRVSLFLLVKVVHMKLAATAAIIPAAKPINANNVYGPA